MLLSVIKKIEKITDRSYGSRLKYCTHPTVYAIG